MPEGFDPMGVTFAVAVIVGILLWLIFGKRHKPPGSDKGTSIR